MLSRIPVCYCPEMNVDIVSSSPSAGKPSRVVAAWQRENFAIDLIAPEPVNAAMLSQVHDAKFVADVLAGRRRNGFGNNDLAVARSLLFTSGAMLAAARLAVENGEVAVAPCSGFHHANYKAPFGYCTFNGLMLAAVMLKNSGRVQRVGILDFDMHIGDGTQAILEHLGAQAWIRHYSAGTVYFKPSQAQSFLAKIPSLVAQMADCDVILYQAGADPHIDDPLGGFLNSAQLAQRDYAVFHTAQKLGVPVAWNLAGGYQVDANGSIEKVLAIHNQTMLQCLKVYGG